MSDPQEYAVGWICALSTEYVAARLFLDEVHEAPNDRSPADGNTYTLGKMGKHNVVIAVLPDSEYGLSSAARVASDMQHSFRNIRIGLMVGIGGGAPYLKKNRDIRLGDVVVSSVVNGKSCVLQYDFGKRIQNERFQPTGFLDQPPRLLRSAVGHLRAKYEEEGHQFEESIDRILRAKPRLKKYRRPDPSSDRLYKSTVVHASDAGESCTESCGDDSNLILRKSRTEDEDNLMIHYGRIASANSLMKDALERDQLAAEADILCFEMEAAGLMNHFPCLIIRGICDYSDSHKNKDWQGYAAMAAAAYAKDLLLEISMADVTRERKITEILSGVEKDVATISVAVEKVVRRQDDDETKDILNWLTPIDYTAQHVDLLRLRQEGTGRWFLDSTEFQSWCNEQKQTLYCSGIPGAGKTILTSSVIQELIGKYHDDPTIGIAYIYINFRRKEDQKLEDLLSSLLKQLVQSQPSLPEVVRKLYIRCQNMSVRPRPDDLSSVIQKVISLYSRVYVIIDALDESSLGKNLSILLHTIFGIQAVSNTNLFVTSRPNAQIEKILQEAVKFTVRADEGDVASYLENQLSELPKFISENPELRSKVKTKILSAIDGMFLLASFYLSSLLGVPSRKVLNDMLEGLSRISDGYSFAYETAMERIENQPPFSRDMAKKILSWITHATRPLSVMELKHALAVELGTSTLSEDNIPETDLISICAGLVVIDDMSNVIRLVHYTTQEYFERKWSKWFPDALEQVAKVCVTYLSYDDFKTGFCPEREEFLRRIHSQYSLYEYAAENLGHHVRIAKIEQDELVMSLLESDGALSSLSQAMMARLALWNDWDHMMFRQQMTGLGTAAYLGLVKSAEKLISQGADVRELDQAGRTPLLIALQKRFILPGSLLPEEQGRHQAAVVKLLLEKGASLETKDTDLGETPLGWAARNGDSEMANLLLEHGALIESVDPWGRTPLFWAVINGHEETVKVLLDKGANLEVREKYRSSHTPLGAATDAGLVKVMKVLLEGGANIEARDDSGFPPLIWACMSEKLDVVRVLLDFKADLEARDTKESCTALFRAVIIRKTAIAELLLDKGADFEARAPDGKTPLSWALMRTPSLDGWSPVPFVKLLLDRGADVNTKDSLGCTPLIWAAQRGDSEIVELLLGKGADMEAKDTSYYGHTALLWAARYGYESIVRLLLDKGANLEVVDQWGWKALQWAEREQRFDVMNLLTASRKS